MMKKINNIFDKIIYFSIILFPILDIITSIMTYNGISVSAGLIIKALIVGLVFVFSFFSKSVSKFSKIILVIYTIFMLGNILNNYKFIFPVPNFEYLKLIIKFSYFIIFAIFFTDYLKNKNYDITILKTPIKIILISWVVALITGTSMPSYSNIYKVGVEGWFYSANELGGLLTLLYPISIYLFFHNEKSRKIEYLYVILHAMALLMLGTKVGLLGFLSITIIYIIYRLIFIKKHSYKNGLILISLILISSFTMWNYLPCVKNTDEKYINISNETIQENLTEEQEKENNDEITNEMIYSGRHNFLKDLKKTKEDTDKLLNDNQTDQNSNNSENNNEIQRKNYKKIANDYLGYMYMSDGYLMLIERDFHDTVFFFGKIGLFFLIFVIVYPILKNIKFILKKIFDIKLDMLLLAIAITLGIAFISGHTLISPMVSFYIAVILGLIACESKSDNKDSKKNILISTIHMDFGGIEKTLINLLKNLNYNKYNVELLLLLNNGPFIKDIPKEVKIITPYPKIFSKFINNNNMISKIIKHTLFNKATAKLWTKNKMYDVAIDYAGYYNFITYYVINTKAKKKLIWVHNQPRFIINKKDTIKYEHFDKIVFVSNVNKEEMVKLHPKYKKKYTVMWNLIEKPFANEKEIKWNSGLKILAVGRLCEQKRFDKLLEIANILKKENFDFCIKILGDGPLEEILKKQAKDLEIMDVVEFVGSKPNVGNYMNTADVYLMTSDHEGLPTVILEALTCNLAIIGIRIPPLEEIEAKIASKNSMLLVDNDIKKVAKVLTKLKSNKGTILDIDLYNNNNLKTFDKLLK